MTEIQKKTLGLATTSLIFGCLALIPLLGIFPALLAIILGIVALVKISNNKDTLKGNGLAISGIVLGAIGLIMLPIIAMLAAIAIPNLLRARHNANEAGAIYNMKVISTAAQSYNAVNDRFPENISELAYADPPYINKELASGAQYGYIFTIVDTNSDNAFLATAIPKEKGVTGTRSFCATDDGVIKQDLEGKNIYTIYTCEGLEDVQHPGYR
ncbi:MAG: DUF4190 domain-containing protein [Candidatus Omnitrophota bacterium]